MGSKTRSEWWESVRPYHEQGVRARREGVPLSDNPLVAPYNISWAKGWQAEDKSLTAAFAQEAEADRSAMVRHMRQQEHDAAYSTVAGLLSRLGIDPYQLRDYLAGLPEED